MDTYESYSIGYLNLCKNVGFKRTLQDTMQGTMLGWILSTSLWSSRGSILQPSMGSTRDFVKTGRTRNTCPQHILMGAGRGEGMGGCKGFHLHKTEYESGVVRGLGGVGGTEYPDKPYFSYIRFSVGCNFSPVPVGRQRGYGRLFIDFCKFGAHENTPSARISARVVSRLAIG